MIFDDFPLYRVPYPWRDNHPISRFTLAIQQRHRSEIPNRVEEKNFFPLLSFFTFFLSFPFFLLHRPREIGKGFSLRDPKKRWIYGPIKRSLSLLFKEEHYSINEEMKFFPFFFSFFLMEILQDSSRRFWKIIKHQIHFETNFVIILWNIYVYFDFNFLKSLPSFSRISFFLPSFFFSFFLLSSFFLLAFLYTFSHADSPLISLSGSSRAFSIVSIFKLYFCCPFVTL